MYLYASKHLADYEWMKDEEREEFRAVKKAAGIDTSDLESEIGPMGRSGSVTVCVGYWRKANAVHGWFVRECGGGKDDCSEIFVTRGNLSRLAKICEHLVSSRDAKLAGEILPPTEGFFFGTYEIDDFYWEDVANTVSIINSALSKFPEDEKRPVSFSYQASW